MRRGQTPRLLLFLLFLIVVITSASRYGVAEQLSSGSAARFVTFDEFLAKSSAARFDQYSGKKDVQVKDTAAFEEMKQYLLAIYEGVGVSHSFVEDSHAVDCVPLHQQPGLRGATAAEKAAALAAGMRGAGEAETGSAVLPPRQRKGQAAAGPTQALDLTLPRGKHDAFGNRIACAPGSIPMRRMTLEEMVRFPTLDEFLAGNKEQVAFINKVDDGSQEEPSLADHYHAVGIQLVDNFGADIWLNLWSPTVSQHQMSLSQLWVSGGSGDNLQTVEAGWQVYPDKWGTDKAVLFIFFTEQNYKVTNPPTKCYNLQCKAFVQVANNVYLGRGFDHYSSTDGDQWGFNLQWKRNTDGNWWLFYRGPENYIAVGYYPSSLFGTGQLSANATRIDFGGETSGVPSALQMGSGALAAAGWQKAAFQNFIFYIDTETISQWANLTQIESNPECYTTDLHNIFGAWGTYLFFGGPKCN
jgi:hypothetical protein